MNDCVIFIEGHCDLEPLRIRSSRSFALDLEVEERLGDRDHFESSVSANPTGSRGANLHKITSICTFIPRLLKGVLSEKGVCGALRAGVRGSFLGSIPTNPRLWLGQISVPGRGETPRRKKSVVSACFAKLCLRAPLREHCIGDTTGPQIGIVIPGVKVELRA